MPGTWCSARSDASKTGSPNRCQAPGATPVRMLANRVPKSVPGTRCSARSDASKTQTVCPSNRCQAPGAAPGRMLANRGPRIGARHPVRRQAGCWQNSARRSLKQVPGTRCGARPDASKTQPGGPSNRCQALGAAPGRMLANSGPSRCQAPGAAPTWGFRMDSGQGESRGCCSGTTGRA